MQPDGSPGLLLVLTLNSVFFLQSQTKGEELILLLSRYFFLRFSSLILILCICVFMHLSAAEGQNKVLNP